MLLEPGDLLAKHCTSTRDIYENRRFLKDLPYEEWIVRRIAEIITDSIDKKKRFRQLDCLKVMRSLVKDKNFPPLSKETTSLLFRIYQHYIFCGKDSYEWCASTLLRGRNLADEEIEWMIENWDQSVHLVNRLLRYPSSNSKISEWAKQRYLNSELLDRKSEVMACFIDDDFSMLCDKEHPRPIIWAIYYANLSIEQKESMLNTLAGLYREPELIEVSSRLQLAKPLKTMLKCHF
jgi:hypothetical protein